MNAPKIIKGVVGGGRYTVTSPIVKEDYGLYLLIEGLELPSTYEVDFSNDEHNGTSVTMIGNSDGVLIPSQFISSGKDVFAFLYHVGVDFGRTVYKFRIPNKLRPDRTDEEPTPEEQSTIDQAISALNSAVAQTAQDKADADVSAQNASADADRAEEAKTDAQNFATQAEQSATSASQSASQASASATASAQSASQSAQIKADVEDLVDDAQASASASAQGASASANSASQASGYAQSASASASSAQGYASQAQTSAQTASTKATEAGTSASTASAKATESAQSATSAQGYAQTAEQAKEDAQTAQGLAESARDDSEQIKSDVQDLADGIDTRLVDVEDDILKAFPTDTASGTIASFTDGADDLPLKSLVVDINPIQDLSHGDPSPENICPISGWTEVDVEQRGVNVWDEEWELGTFDTTTGQNIDTSSALRQIRAKRLIPVVAENEYYLTTSIGVWTMFFDIDKNVIAPPSGVHRKVNNCIRIGGDTSEPFNKFTPPQGCAYIRFYCQGVYGETYNHDISINYPSTDHDYHSYTGRSITIDLGQTVYGGKLDVLTGELTVDKGYLLKNTADMDNSEDYPGWKASGIRGLIGGGINSRVYGAFTNISPASGHGGCGGVGANTNEETNNTLILSREYFGKSQTEWQALALDVQFVIPLVTPIEIQLTPNQVNSLLGVNNIWADSGDVEVVYRADTKLFIERLTAPDSADMIADTNITSGKYFMVGNSLYKATANIANGSAIVVGTNCIRKSLSEALNEINV